MFSPEHFMARLAALVPRPRTNLTRYHGVFAPNCKLRHLIVPRTSAQTRNHRREAAQHCADARNHPAASAITDTAPTAPLTWAERLQRVFAIDITQCPHCGGRLRVIADVTDPHLIQGILDRNLPDSGRSIGGALEGSTSQIGQLQPLAPWPN